MPKTAQERIRIRGWKTAGVRVETSDVPAVRSRATYSDSLVHRLVSSSATTVFALLEFWPCSAGFIRPAGMSLASNHGLAPPPCRGKCHTPLAPDVTALPHVLRRLTSRCEWTPLRMGCVAGESGSNSNISTRMAADRPQPPETLRIVPVAYPPKLRTPKLPGRASPTSPPSTPRACRNPL